MRASDDERNAVADKLSRHYAEGRLDEVEFKNRLDTAMSATTRGDLNGLFDDLPRCPASRRLRRRGTAASCPGSSSWSLVAIAAGATMPFYPLYHVPWFLFAVVGLLPVAPGRAGTTTRTAPRRRMGPAQLGHGPLSRRRAPPAPPTSRGQPDGQHCPPTPPPAGRRLHDLAAGDGRRRPGHAALPGALRRPARRRARGDRRALRRLHRPPRPGGPGPGRAVRMWHVITGRARRRAARRHADRAARQG